MRVQAVIVLLMGGCSFSVDAVSIFSGPDLSGGHVDDLASADLAVPIDLTAMDATNPDDLSDLAQPPSPDLRCVTPLFPGFNNGATDPFDCRGCGCKIDDFTALSGDRWTVTAGTGWMLTMSGGTLALFNATAGFASSETLSSTGHFYMKGDFDALVDYKMVTWPNYTGGELTASTDDGTTTKAEAHTYILGTRNWYLVVNGQVMNLMGAGTFGTFELIRTGTTICANIAGGPTNCRANSGGANLALSMLMDNQDSSCSSACGGAGCCAERMEFTNLRLASGVIVKAP